MSEAIDRHTLPIETAGPRLARALGLMVEEIRDAAAETRRAEAALTVARRRQRQLELAAERVLDTVPGEERKRVRAAIHGAGRTPDLQRHRRLRPGGRAEALRFYLLETEGRVFSVSDATAWLTEQGHPAHPKDVSTSLAGLARQGFVMRTGRGRYMANEMHPLLLDLHLAELQTAVRSTP